MSSAVDPVSVGMTILKFLIMGVLIYMAVAGGFTLSYYFHYQAGTKNGRWYKDRPNWIPTEWLDWAGYPGKFKSISSMTSPTMSITETMTNVTSVNKCMLKCDKQNTNQEEPKCAGFVFDSVGNNCYISDTIDFVNSSSSSNTVYLYSSSLYTPSVRTYDKYTSNALPTSGADVGKFIASYIETNGSTGCSANCLSNTTCTGYMFRSSDKNCGMVTNMDITKLVSTTGIDSYFLTAAKLTDVSTQYWK